MWNFSGSERLILDTIWRYGPIARVEIAERTLLGAATVTRLTKGLRAKGLIIESVQREGLRGQPARPLSLNPKGGFAFGVNFSHSYMDTGFIDLVGNVLSSERIPFDRPQLNVIGRTARAELIRQMKQLRIAKERIVGAGFSVPGDFGADRTLFKAHAYFPDLLNRDLSAEFQSKMPVNVVVENDAASAAMGERVHGAGKTFKSFALIHIGHGVGGGIVLDGTLYRGVHSNAGAIGTLYPMDKPRPSGQDLFECLAREGVEIRDFNGLEALKLPDCAPLQRWIARAGAQLGTGIHIAARLFDPHAVVIGGRLPPQLLSEMLKASDLDTAFRPSQTIPRPDVVTSQLGPLAGVIGAASICIFRTFFSG